jgi:hypothetical protein
MTDIITEMAKHYGIPEEEILQSIHDELLKRVPKIILTKDENNDVVIHLAECPLASSQTLFNWDKLEPVEVKKCSCIPSKYNHAFRRSTA